MTEGYSSALSGSTAGQRAEGPPARRSSGEEGEVREGTDSGGQGDTSPDGSDTHGSLWGLSQTDKAFLSPLCVSLPPLVRSPTVIVLISSLIQPISCSFGF